MDDDAVAQSRGFSRRSLLGWMGGGIAVGAVGGGVGANLASASPEPVPTVADVLARRVPFEGFHQAGIATPAQAHAAVAAFDLTAAVDPRSGLADVFKRWTQVARRLTQGDRTDDDTSRSLVAEEGPASLTITVGVGGSALDKLGIPRPPELQDLPSFPDDRLDAGRTGGDVFVQFCADDPFVVADAGRAFRQTSTGVLVGRWNWDGFQGAGSRNRSTTPRNLMGQLDGTSNVTAGAAEYGGPVWVPRSAPSWMRGGTYLVVRRLRMLLAEWDQQPIETQERVLGRHKVSGAPLGGSAESDPVDLEAVGPDGSPLIPRDSHVRLSRPTPGSSEHMLRRGYSYRAGTLPDGAEDAGLLFIAYQADPRAAFVAVQQRLSTHDALRHFSVTTGSALFAILPGVADSGDWLGRELLS